MGYGVMPYAVKLDALRSMAGSKDAGFMNSVRLRVEDDDEDDAKTAAECNRQLIMGLAEGESYESSCSHKYYYVLECWCDAFGHFLTNWNHSPMRYSWFDTIQEKVKESGFKVTLPGDLIYRYDILKGLPTPADFPCVGTLELAKMPKISSILKNNIAKVKDSNVQDALKEYHGWLEHCIEAKTDLVLCYY
ncbi:unnamed protein product [Cylindrotheca closterium]|uniref:DUF7691 domain-containing protein n=1 Tax=Cylindrotheca closterium TaxID=2856 RepID=A0AAD2FJD9_9STRA|nr:unnamed protein product [Cylindrotheca closterium]CAJ1945056.1 unnamed protein product [Cylindrotheca closterium]